MRFDAGARSNFPAVGDWVGITLLPDKTHATIQALLPRQTKLSRTVAGRRNDEQILAANVDIVFIVPSVTPGLKFAPIQPLSAVAWGHGGRPIRPLNKAGLAGRGRAPW